MKKIKILDVTLRDGGCVNDFNFGVNYMNQILTAQEKSGVDIIELGYIDEKDGSELGRTKYSNEKVISQNFLKAKKPGTIYVAMIDYGKYDFSKLEDRSENGIDGIRVAFHRKDYKKISEIGNVIMNKGYDFYIQPMITFKYDDRELLDLIDIINTELSNASGLYIVDSFGEMRPDDVLRLLNLIDHNLTKSISLGLHSHNNLQMSYSNACAMMEYSTDRDIIIDSSILGMGKGAGNLNTELLMEHINKYFKGNYSIEPLLVCIDEVINQIHEEFRWGYSVEYYLSSVNGCTPSYASHFYNKRMLSVDQVNELLNEIPDEKKVSFDKAFAEKLYIEYMERNDVDDSIVVDVIKEKLKGKDVLLVAPGKTVQTHKDKIENLISENNIVSIGLNSTIGMSFDFDFITRSEILAKKRGHSSLIIPSNLSSVDNYVDSSEVMVIDYKKWININGQSHDSSAVIIMNLLKECGISKVYLAGFDGFSANINENYYDPSMRRPVSDREQNERNDYYKKMFDKFAKDGIDIRFVTESKYQ